MLRERRCFYWIGIAVMVLFFHGHGFCYDVTDKLSIGGVVSGAYQYQSVDDPSDVDNAGRGALPIQPEFSFRPTERDEVFDKFGFAAGNGLNEKSPFVLASWGADLEDDVKDINGRHRSPGKPNVGKGLAQMPQGHLGKGRIQQEAEDRPDRRFQWCGAFREGAAEEQAKSYRGQVDEDLVFLKGLPFHSLEACVRIVRTSILWLSGLKGR